MSDISKLVKDVVASPLGEVIASVGQGVADAQAALDEGSLSKTLEIYSEGGEDLLQVLRDIGYMPTFYTLPETVGEVKVALKLGGGTNAGATGASRLSSSTVQPLVNASLSRTGLNLPGIKPKLYATPIDAGYANRYSHQAEIGAKLTFKIVPVPPPAGTDELRLLPELVGKTAAVALEILASLNLEGRFIDSEDNEVDSPDDARLITAQSPVYHSDNPIIIRAENIITLSLEDEA